jgi:hypothetical protein
VADKRTLYADELSGIHLRGRIEFTHTSATGWETTIEGQLVDVTHSSAVPEVTVGLTSAPGGIYLLNLAPDTHVTFWPIT